MTVNSTTNFIVSITSLLLLILLFINYYSKKQMRQLIEKIVSMKIKKSVLVKYYQVDKTTFRKWVEYFCDDMYPDVKIYHQKRKVTLKEFYLIKQKLGEMKEHGVLSKKDIVELGSGTYKSLRESVQKYPENFGITAEHFELLRIFPPKIGKKILEHYGE